MKAKNNNINKMEKVERPTNLKEPATERQPSLA
jgi:hypothetical protein